jgi:hypothetical protein
MPGKHGNSEGSITKRKDGLGNLDTERLCSFQIYYEFKSGWLRHRQVRRLGAS